MFSLLPHLGWESNLVYCIDNTSATSSEATVSPQAGLDNPISNKELKSSLPSPATLVNEVSKDLSAALVSANDTNVSGSFVTINSPTVNISIPKSVYTHGLNFVTTGAATAAGLKLGQSMPTIAGKATALFGVVAATHVINNIVNLASDALEQSSKTFSSSSSAPSPSLRQAGSEEQVSSPITETSTSFGQEEVSRNFYIPSTLENNPDLFSSDKVIELLNNFQMIPVINIMFLFLLLTSFIGIMFTRGQINLDFLKSLPLGSAGASTKLYALSQFLLKKWAHSSLVLFIISWVMLVILNLVHIKYMGIFVDNFDYFSHVYQNIKSPSQPPK